MKDVILAHQLSCFRGVGQTVKVKPIKCTRNILFVWVGRMSRINLTKVNRVSCISE